MKTETHPVVVVGDGIAGAATCAALAIRGLPVIWIAAGRTSDQKPGESLAAAAGPLLAGIGAEGILAKSVHRRMETSFSSWGSDALLERSAIATPNGLGTVIDRVAFETDLKRHAEGSGVQSLCGSLTEFTYRDGGWDLLTDAGASVRASFLVDATGRLALIGRRMAAMRRADRLVAAYAFLPHVEPDIQPTNTTVIEAVETGWWYATLLRDGRLAVNYYSDPDLFPRRLRHSTDAWRQLIEQTRYISKWIETGGFVTNAAPLLATAGTTWLDRTSGEGWIAVGDAATAFDPLSAHGMTTALWTGVEAANTIEAWARGDSTGLDAYSEKLAAGFASFLEDRQRIYRRESRFFDRPFWARRNGSKSSMSVDLGLPVMDNAFANTI